MRLGTIAQAELLDRLGIKGADLYRFTIGDAAIPVVVIADTSELSGVPQRRQVALANAVGAVVGQVGVLEIATRDVPLLVTIKNGGNAGFGNQPLNISHSTDPQITAGFVLAVQPPVTYQIPDAADPFERRFNLAYGTTAAPGGVLIDSVAIGVSTQIRLSPNGRLIIAGSVVNTIAVPNFRVEEYAAYERSR